MTAGWTTPEDIVQRVRRVWDRGEILAARIGDPSPFPLRIRPFARPGSRALGERFGEVREWIAKLEHASKCSRGFGYEIEWETINHRQLGSNRVPRAVVVPSEADALLLLSCGGEASRWDALVGLTSETFPQLADWVRKRPLRLLELEGEWEHILGVLRWFANNPRPSVYVRQIGVAGIDSKFIESRRALLGELLDLVLKPDQISHDAVGARAFEQRYGLRSKPIRLRLRSLDESLHFGGLMDVEAPVTEWARTPLSVDRLILTENEVNFLAFPTLPRSAIAFGAGYSVVERLPEIPWLRDRLIFYWGDIDTHGFAILDKLRNSFPNARSFLMDQETLLEHRNLWVFEPDGLTVALENLTADEGELYEDLRRDRFGRSVRLEQERVGFAFIERAIAWIEEASRVPFRRSTPRGFVFDTELSSVSDRPETWIDPRDTRNWVGGDPVLDWLDMYGSAAGFPRDDELEGHDPRTDFRQFVVERGSAFRAAIVEFLAGQTEVVRIEQREDRSAWAQETLVALREGPAMISGGLLQDPERGANAAPDLLVRSDVLCSLFPDALPVEAASTGAPRLAHASFHYRPITIAFRSFDLTADGHVSTASDQLVYAVQAWFHAQAIGWVQGQSLPSAYVLGRNWRQAGARGTGALERLGRVDVDRWLPLRNCGIGDLARGAAAWRRRLRSEGGNWQVLPVPSVPELYPHARNSDDAPWHVTKRRLAEELQELTLLPGVNPERRQRAHELGLFRWSDESVSPAALGVTSPLAAVQLDAVLAANRAATPVVHPPRVTLSSDRWRQTLKPEFFVDFETVSHLEDDLVDLPRQGGQALIVQVGCGHVAADGEWSFAQWTVDQVTVSEERRVLDSWLEHMVETSKLEGSDLRLAKICHWSAAERVHLETACENARQRHPGNDWHPQLPWFDVLQEVVRAAPVGVTGAFSFGLKAMAKAMHAAGLISTTWPAGPADGLGAMVATWRAARETNRLSEHPLMRDVARYNEVDCRVMMEILSWLRRHR